MLIGYLGPAGTFTQEAVHQFITELKLEGAITKPIDSIESIFDEFVKGIIDAAVLPLRNSFRGEYKETVNCLEAYKLNFQYTIKLKIKLYIGIHPDAEKSDIKEIRSHKSALDQCSDYLSANFPNIPKKEDLSTTNAMKIIHDENQKKIASVGSKGSIELYGLKIFDEDVGTSKESYTEFIYLSKEDF